MNQPLAAGAVEQLHGLRVRLAAASPVAARTFLSAVRSWLRCVRFCAARGRDWRICFLADLVRGTTTSRIKGHAGCRTAGAERES